MNHSHYQQFALELTMQDVLDNMTELSAEIAMQFSNSGLEILSIEPDNEDKTSVIPFKRKVS